MTDSIYWIWLQLVFGIATRRAELMMDYFSYPSQIYEGICSGGPAVGMLKPTEISAVETAMEKAREIERLTLKKGCQIITPTHPDYPPLLGVLYDRPAALYCKGELACLKNAVAVTVVGTRKHTDYGKNAAAMFARALAQNGVVVVSGLAPGIDTESHRAALESGGKTVGVLGCGIDVDYPKSNRAIKTAVSQNGAVITEFPIGVKPYAGNFPLRNRILSGLSQATLVVEADIRSGSLITARLAQEQGRDLFAVPGPVFSRGGQGSNLLIKEGARLADCVEDILSLYPQFPRLQAGAGAPSAPRKAKPLMREDAPESRVFAPEHAPPARPKALPAGISESGAEVYAALGQETLTVDDLVGAVGMQAGEILCALTELEIYGLIQSYPGRRFGMI